LPLREHEPVESGEFTRKLTAILAADLAGYSRLMGMDEEGTLRRLSERRAGLIDPKIAEYRGRIVKSTGDGLLVEFSSVIDAVRCAVDIQRAMAGANEPLPADRRMDFRIGINLGDVMTLEDDIFGDGVNVAARIEGLADPGGVWVSRIVADQVQDKLDIAFQDMGERQVKNIARPVRILRVLLDGHAPGPRPAPRRRRRLLASPQRRWLALALALFLAAAGGVALWQIAGQAPPPALSGSGPSIAVLPFSSFGGDERQATLANGIVEDILTQLARVAGLNVVSRNATARYANTAVDIPKIGQALGARYVLEGSLRPVGNQIRVTGQLIEVATGTHVWAEHFDLPLADAGTSEDALIETITTELVVQMRNRDLQLAKATPGPRLDAYGYYLLGKDALDHADMRGIEVAGKMFDAAVAADPGYAPAVAGKALVALRRFQLNIDGLEREPALSRMFDQAQKALAMNAGASDAVDVVAQVYLYRRQYDQAVDLLHKAIAATADDADLQESLADVYVYAGDASKGVEMLDRLMRIDPFLDRTVFAIYGRGLLLTGHLDKAIENLEICMVRAAEFAPCFDAAAVAYAEAGRLSDAQDALARSRQLNPILSLANLPEFMPFKNPADLQRFQSGLARAGLD
jgi:adenylate cyclase